MTSLPSRSLLAAIERNRKRVWGLCYRLTGSRQDADDLAQEAIARAIEREEGLAHKDALDGWLFRIATTVCLDQLRRDRVERQRSSLIDPLDEPDLPAFTSTKPDPEASVILRDDVRFAVMAALQWLPARQRAALVLHEVYGWPLEEVGKALNVNANAAKALTNRARSRLAAARRRLDVDPVADPRVVDGLVRAIETRSAEAFTSLLDEDVWGVIDRGMRRTPVKPVFGPRALTRMWINVGRRRPEPMRPRVARINGEPAVVIALPESGGAVWGTLHIETRNGRIAAMRVLRDPRRLALLGGAETEA
ncbi:MAG: sigma-70 family RNA polymerase sigma factor [Deltaproteobacteria bacterium]|nr:sigma-70 family RNA polymerase sigma factor [Deltaproteobacteria bacterium]